MIYGIGTDIVQIARISDSVRRFGERFARKVLTAEELPEYLASRHPERLLAKRFAAKEAVVKALGLGFREGLAFHLIGITHDRHGKPGVVYRGRALAYIGEIGITESMISLSDERHYAVAFAVLLRS
jgi:holo-[acyl-carrier protein] synthase